MNTSITEEKIIEFISAIEQRPNLWNYRLKSSFREKQKDMAAVAEIFNVPGEIE